MGAMTDEIVLRNPTDAEFPRFIAPLSIAFNEPLSDAAIENDRRTIELDRFVGALDGDAVVGCGGTYSFRLTVPGGEVAAAGVTAVGVLPSHRRRGILRQMMTWLLAQARERSEPVAILWASEAAIYQRFGYGPGTLQSQFDAVKDKVRFVRPVESPGRIRIVDVDEAVTRFPAVYDEIRRSTPGTVSRTEARWRWETLADAEWMRHGNGAKVLALLEVDGAVRGYAIYRTRSDWDHLGPKGVVTVLEVSALDAVTEQALWQWIFGIDLIGSVRCLARTRAAPDAIDGHRAAAPRHHLRGWHLAANHRPARRPGGSGLPRPGRPRRRRARRVLPVERRAMAALRAGRRRVRRQRDGAASVTRAPDSVAVDLALDISDVAAVYLGAFRFADLRRAGRVREARPGAVARADALFATEVAPSNGTMF